MDFDKPKVYGDTSITDGLVYLGGKFSTKINTNNNININNYLSFNTNINILFDINIVFNTDINILFNINIFMTYRPIM